MPELRRINQHFYRVPYSSLLAFIFAVLGIILTGATYRPTFLPLFQYFPSSRWRSALSLVEFLLVVTAFLHVASLFMAFMATRSSSLPRFLGKPRRLCGIWTSTMTMGLLVLLAMILVVVTVAFSGTAAAVRVIGPGMSHACATVPNSGNPDEVCLPLKMFGALDVMCGPNYTNFCQFWENKLRLNSMIAGALFLLFSNLFLLSCSVANFMRFRHDIIDDVIKEPLYQAQGEPEFQEPYRRNLQAVYSV